MYDTSGARLIFGGASKSKFKRIVLEFIDLPTTVPESVVRKLHEYVIYPRVFFPLKIDLNNLIGLRGCGGLARFETPFLAKIRTHL